ncbi:hypothetical protein G3M48_004186 [Beauveria asiatica]|uniref:Uncharacterized protein n=1 Tax=Beauveria asiatica TaxID=1069075 RepID=A0AAW0RUT4_9HYPO
MQFSVSILALFASVAMAGKICTPAGVVRVSCRRAHQIHHVTQQSSNLRGTPRNVPRLILAAPAFAALAASTTKS